MSRAGTSTTTTTTTSSGLFSPLHQRLIEFEGRIRRWKFFGGNRRQPRSASSDPKAGPLSARSTPKRPVAFPPGALTCPVPRRGMMLPININSEPDRPTVSEEELIERDREIAAQSGVIKIGPQIYNNVTYKQLVLLGDLGEGACGRVTQMRLDNRIIAVKEMKRTNEAEGRRVFTDLHVITRSNDCEFIVHSYGYILTPDNVYICMEMMATCLEKLYKDHLLPQQQFFPVPVLGKISVSVIKALKYLKEQHEIMHRDIKPSNILMDFNGNIKLCDFGIAGRLIDSLASTSSMGATAYLSPERIGEYRRYDVRADVWALGITLVELALCRYPYTFNSPFDLMIAIGHNPAPQLPESFPPEFRNFIAQCLEKNVTNRPKYDKLVETEWFIRSDAAHVNVGEWLEEITGETGEE
uniref:mitogen-activated protein kinase kinase n=1 Tax=Panagrellus redivivus TaxID=6233 RepID=A0A7E4VUI3_PANRE